MRLNLAGSIAVAVAMVVLIIAYASVFTVYQTRQAIVVRLGEPKRVITEPGLHFKAPFIDRTRTFDKRWLEWDGDPNQIPTRDKKYIWVDAYARWRISDPILFYQRLRDETGAQSRLDDIIDGEIRNVIANHDLIELVRTSSRKFDLGEFEELGQVKDEEFSVRYGREVLRAEVLEKASSVMPEYGIELADVRIKRVNYVESVQVKVFDRMISERKRIAERYRSEGQGKGAEIRGQVDRELKTIQSEAYRKATEIRGRGDAEATSIYAEAYNRDPEFYEFMRSLETYETVIDENTTIVLSTDGQLLRWLE